MNDPHPSDPVEPRPPRDERLARLLHACCAASEEFAGGQYAGLGPAITGPQRQKRERAAAAVHDYVEAQLRSARVGGPTTAPSGSGAVLAFPRQPVSYRLEPYHTDAGDVMTGVACDDASLTFDGRFVCVIPGPPGISERVGRTLLRVLSDRT